MGRVEGKVVLITGAARGQGVRPDLDHPTREDAMPAFPAMQAMPIPFIDPVDISHLVVYLASDESRYMTGMNLRVDAGAMLKTSFGVSLRR
jgi:NAD(P)-dependent dehydrogenase (short-subunit alcohol dehydrogenase family)